MKFFNLSLVFAVIVFASCSKGSSDNTSTKIHIISSAITGSSTNNALILQQEIDSCNANPDGGTVELQAGTYMTGPIYMLSNVNLQLDAGAILTADTTESDYFSGGKVLNLIYSGTTSLQNVSITGSGTIDGKGAPWWAKYPSAASSRPRLIYITGCTNLNIDGITLINSPSFHIVPYQCHNVTINNVTITAPSNSPNTDGIDPSQSYNVTITNCTIDNGDDDIAIKASALCENVIIKHCTFLHGHGLSIGSETNGGMKNLTVDSCTFNGTQYGIRLKSYASAGGLMSNLSYSNISMQNVQNPIYVNLNYSNMGSGTGNIPSVNGLTINNLTATGASNAGSITGLSNSILQNITLSNINISANSNMIMSYANNVTISNAVINNVTVALGSGNITTSNVTGRTGF